MPMTAPFRARTEDGSPTGPVLYTGVHADDAAALTHCAANGVDLTRADLRNRDLRNADVSGLIAPKCDLRGANCRGWTANRLVAGRRCELSAAILSGATLAEDALISGVMTHVNLACTRPGRLRIDTGPETVLRGCDWTVCTDVIELPVTKRERNTVGRVVAIRSSSEWKVHAGARGVIAEASAAATLAPNAEYGAVVTYLGSPEYAARKAEVSALAGAAVTNEGEVVTSGGEPVTEGEL